MFRLTLQGVTVECDTVDEAFALTGLARPAGSFPRTPEPQAPAHLARKPTAHAPLPQGQMSPTGKTKACRQCKKKFPVLSRSDCAATRCQVCRGEAAPTPAVKATPAEQVANKAAAKAMLGRPPIRPDEPTKACSVCGDKVRVADTNAAGRCKDCQPIGGGK